MSGLKKHTHNKDGEFISSALKKAKEKRVLTVGVAFLASVVVLTTVIRLILPAVAMTRTERILDCAFEVHRHTPECYVQQPVYDASGNQTGTEAVLICGKADYAVHVHNDDCYRNVILTDEAGKALKNENGEYQTKRVLVCTLPEIAEHKHTEACFADYRYLACEKEETPGHIHTEECYEEVQGELTCGKEEHTHSEACYENVVIGTEQVLSCGLEEGAAEGSHFETRVETHTEYRTVTREEVHPVTRIDEETGEEITEDVIELVEVQEPYEVTEEIQEEVTDYHHHTENCYTTIEQTELQLTCGLEEHTHDESCYAKEQQLICGKEAGEGSHAHSEACWRTEKQVICGQLELHTHTEECYEKGPNGESPEAMGWIRYTTDEHGNRVLEGMYEHRICGLPELLEHRHVSDCIKTVQVVIEEETTEEESTEAETTEAAVERAEGEITEAAAEGTGTEEEITEAAVEGTEEEITEEIEPEAVVTTELEDEELDTDAAETEAEETETEEFETEAKETGEFETEFETESGTEATETEEYETDEIETEELETEEFEAEELETEELENEEFEAEELETEEFETEEFETEEIETEEETDEEEAEEITSLSRDGLTIAALGTALPEGAALNFRVLSGESAEGARTALMNFLAGKKNVKALAPAVEADPEISLPLPGMKKLNAKSVGLKKAGLAGMLPGDFADEEIMGNAMDSGLTADGTDTVEPNGDTAGTKDSGENPETGIRSETRYQFFDISLDYDKEEGAYEDGFAVSVMLPEAVTGRDFHLYHIHEEEDGSQAISELTGEDFTLIGAEGETTAEDGAAAQTVEGFSFVTDCFSVFVLEYTVDFEYTDPETGETYAFTLTGGEDMLLSTLLEVLNIQADLTGSAVRFSNETLLTFTPVTDEEGIIRDWLIESLIPFDTEEELVITLADGSEITIAVTDDQIVTYVIDSAGDTWSVTVEYEKEAGIPEDSVLEVKEITEEDEAYAAYVAAASEALLTEENNRAISGAKLFDITIMHDGQKVVPAAPVKVCIEFMPMETEESGRAVLLHYRDAQEEGSESGAYGTEENTGIEGKIEENIEIAKNTETSLETLETAEMPASSKAANNQIGTVEIMKAPEFSLNETTLTGVTFESDGFSVYGVIYTVDFHYEVNGKMYEFGIPGGGFASFYKIVEVLGIARIGENTADSGENEDVKAENTAENTAESDVYNVVEETGVEESAANTGSGYEESISLNNVAVSEATKKFVADVASVEFSSPELVWVGKVDEATTVGGLKEANGLEVQYSAELTEEQIAEINSSTVEAGDWALISMQPFTSEETLTVTMQNGETFTIFVTDGQLHTFVISDRGDTYEVIVTYDDTAEIPEDAELVVKEILADSEEFAENLDLVKEVFAEKDDLDIEDAVQFDISIVSGNEEVEPKEGSTVKVEIRLAKSLLVGVASVEEVSEIETESDGGAASEAKAGLFMYDGREISLDSAVLTECRITHIAGDGTAEIIEDVESSVTDDKIVMQFETGSFSDYMIQPGNYGSVNLNDLPSTIYVGDEIYMQNLGDYWVTGIGSVVTETKYNNNSDDYKSVRATNTGTFRICHRNDWNNGNTGYSGQYNGKYITILPARSEGNYAGTTPPATIDTINNASIGLTLNLFDYDLDDYLDNRFNNKDYGSTEGGFVIHGINNGNSLKFWGSGITDSSYGAQNNYVEHGVTNIVKNTTDTGSAGGYPVLKADNTSLDYLFTPSDGTDKKAYKNVNGLFKKDGDYYVYDSNQNYAYYDVSQGDNGSFQVYNRTYEQKSRTAGGEQASTTNGKAIGFFPFHKWDEDYDLYVNWNKNLNHHFGMSMSVPFSLPKDPKAVVDTNNQPIIFEFSGDDDLWVFIDGKLAMDIGGIHQPTSGTINFQTGVVTVNGAQQNGFDFSGLYDGKKHTLEVFYIERGGCDSNCMIKFNLTQYGDVHFDKTDKYNQNTKLEGAVFGIYKDAACTDPLMEALKNGTRRAYVAESNTQGRVQFSDIPLGTYYLKELHAPEGYPLDNTVHTVNVYLDQTTNQVKVAVTIDGMDVANGVKILNEKPKPVDLGLKKEWQNSTGQSISAPANSSATFEIKRFRTYETYTEQTIEGQGRDVSHLTVGWVHNGEYHVYEEFDLIANSTANISWSYVNGYTGSKDCIENGTRIDKDGVYGNIIAESLTMPAAGQTATFYIVDDSENGDAIRSINVAGQQFYGNSGGGVIHTFSTVTEPDPYPSFNYSGAYVTNNQVTLPINASTWQYDFNDLPTFGRGSVAGVDYEVSFNYSYYIEEVSSSSPAGTTVVYKDLNGNVINTPLDAETHTSGTQTIINQVDLGALELTKIVTFNNRADTSTKTNGTYKFTVTGTSGTYTQGINHTVEITFVNGKATKYKVDNVETNVTGTNNSWSVLLNDLIPGDYVVQETDSGNLILKSVTGGIGDGSVETKKVTALVTHGKNTSATLENTAKTTFTNNHSETDVTIKKVDGSSKLPINGAKFSFKTGPEYANLSNYQITNLSDNTTAAIEDLSTLNGVINVINIPSGGIKIAGLPNGTYTLTEEKAPDGYVITQGAIVFTATDGKVRRAGDDSDETGEFTFVIENEPGAALPNTGGPGTKLIYLLGIMLTGLAGAGLVMKRRRRKVA